MVSSNKFFSVQPNIWKKFLNPTLLPLNQTSPKSATFPCYWFITCNRCYIQMMSIVAPHLNVKAFGHLACKMRAYKQNLRCESDIFGIVASFKHAPFLGIHQTWTRKILLQLLELFNNLILICLPNINSLLVCSIFSLHKFDLTDLLVGSYRFICFGFCRAPESSKVVETSSWCVLWFWRQDRIISASSIRIWSSF